MILAPGDKASIVAPAAQFRSADRALLGKAEELLQSWGLQTSVRVDHGHHYYLAGPDAARAAHLNDALCDDAKVIFCTRGGYGSPRLLRHLRFTDAQPKLLVGYSDVTALHLACARFAPNIGLIHGPNVATQQLLGPGPECQRNRESLYTALFSRAYRIDEQIDCLVPGRVTGRLTGGCLSLVAGSLGTPFGIDADGAVLFLEDTGEPPYRIDRMITQLRNSGAFNSVKGVLFGVMKNCTDPYNDLRSVITDLLGDLRIPIGFGLPSGHGDLNLSLRFDCHATLDTVDGRFTLKRS